VTEPARTSTSPRSERRSNVLPLPSRPHTSFPRLGLVPDRGQLDRPLQRRLCPADGVVAERVDPLFANLGLISILENRQVGQQAARLERRPVPLRPELDRPLQRRLCPADGVVAERVDPEQYLFRVAVPAGAVPGDARGVQLEREKHDQLG
jgi:hypothetical protein